MTGLYLTNISDDSTTSSQGANFERRLDHYHSLVVIIISLLTVFGNSLTITAVVTTRYLQQKRNVLIVSLAVADLLVGLCGIVLAIMRLTYLKGGNGIVIHGLLHSLLGRASNMHLCIMAVERYIAISYPLHFHILVTPRRLAVSILFIWVCTFAVTLTSLIWHFSSQEPSYQSPSPLILYRISVNFCLYLVIGCSILVLYLKILSVVRRQAQATAAGTNVREIGSNRIKGTKLILFVIMAYLVTGAPYFITVWLYIYFPSYALLIASTCTSFISRLNSIINTLLYAYVSSEFRRAYRRLLCMKRIGALPVVAPVLST